MTRTRFSDSSQKLIKKLALEGRHEAFKLSEILLKISPDPEAEKKVQQGNVLLSSSLEPQSKLDEWQYSQFISDEFKILIELDPNEALRVVATALSDFLHFSYPEREGEKKYDDISQIWRPSIEKHTQNHRYNDIEDSLVDAVRDSSLAIIQKNPNQLQEIVEQLESNKWVVFRRTALFLLSKNPTQNPELVCGRLTNKELFTDSSFRHEYAQLSREGFSVLKPEEQAIIFDWIEKAEEIKEAIKKNELESGKEKPYIETWQRDKLSFFKRDLTGKWKEYYDELISRYGAAKNADFSYYSTSWVGPKSQVSAQELIDWGKDKMFDFLKNWEPERKNRSDFGPTKEGVGRQISEAIKLNPQFFEEIAEEFKGLDPTYVRSYLDGFYAILQSDRVFDWDKILTLCQWVVDQPREIPDRDGGVMDQDPDWGWARRTVASLISRGLSENLISFDQRERVWKIIEVLTDDPNPTAEEEKTRKGDPVEDPYTLSINTTRGTAVGAVAEYGLWVYRSKEEENKEELKSGFTVMPEVKEIFEKHLDQDVDLSVAVRAVYGRFFPWILLLDKEWTIENVGNIFSGEFSSPLYQAAWQTYIVYVSAYSNVFEVLAHQYEKAVDNIDKLKKGDRFNPNEHLAAHLMIYYWLGKLELRSELLAKFWINAGEDLRQYAIDFIGRSLFSDNDQLPIETQQRLKDLWEMRIKVAEEAVDKKSYVGEMAAFGMWFASGKLDEKWCVDQYLRALEIADPKTNIDYYLSKRLKETVKSFPIEAIKILEKLVLGDRQTWLIFGNKDELDQILISALTSSDSNARNVAEILVNRIISRGHPEFRQLLLISK